MRQWGRTVRGGVLLTAGALTAGALVVTGLTGVAHARPAPTHSSALTVGTAKTARCHLGVGRPTWCGSIRVPLDYTDPTAPRIGVGFGWVPSSRRSVGTLVAMEGGPGYPSTGTGRGDRLPNGDVRFNRRT